MEIFTIVARWVAVNKEFTVALVLCGILMKTAWKLRHKHWKELLREGATFVGVAIALQFGIFALLNGMVPSIMANVQSSVVTQGASQVAGNTLSAGGAILDTLVSGGSGAVPQIELGDINVPAGTQGNLVDDLMGVLESGKSTATNAVERLTQPQAPVQSNAQAPVNASIDAPAEAPVGEYVVQPGDSIGKIAKRLGIDAGALCAANGLSNCSLINVGQKLVMPGAVAKALNETVAIETSNKIATPRVTSNQTVYTAPKLNQSYIPNTWNVIERGEMSVGAPANMSTNTGEVFASFPTK